MGKNQHVVPHGNSRAVKGAGNSKATRVHPTQSKAIKAAVPIAKNEKSDVVIHRSDGQDPRPGQLRERPVPTAR